MKKILISILIVLCLCLPSYALGPMMNLMATGSSDPCVDMGASGTYEFWWNGEYAADTDKACYNSGASVNDGVDSGSVIAAGGKVNGVYGALVGAADDHVRWDGIAPDSTIDDAGWVKIAVTTPASFTGTSMFWEIYYDADNNIIGYFNANTIRLRHRGQGEVALLYASTATLSVATTYYIWFTWKDTATDTMCIKICDDSACSGESWECGARDIFDFAADHPTDISIGDDQTDIISVNGSWKLDDLVMGIGYIGD